MISSGSLFNKALLVEDELSLAVSIGLSLNRLHIPHNHVSSLGQAFAYIADDNSFSGTDLVLLDRKLPDGEGLDLCAQLRTRNYRGSLLVLSAFGSVDDRIKGLDLGADDYLPKPFDWEEFSARLRALSRRLKSAPSSLPVMEALWTFDEDLYEVVGPKGKVRLTPLEFKLCRELIEKPGQLVSRDELLKNVWGYQFLPKTRTLDFFLGRLRKRFELNPDAPIHFLTMRGLGVRFDP